MVRYSGSSRSRKLAQGINGALSPGWGIVGTHIRPSAARRGIGRALFDVTRKAAVEAGIANIDASVAANNPEGLAYYEAMGFRIYRTPENLICKRFNVFE